MSTTVMDIYTNGGHRATPPFPAELAPIYQSHAYTRWKLRESNFTFYRIRGGQSTPVLRSSKLVRNAYCNILLGGKRSSFD